MAKLRPREGQRLAQVPQQVSDKVRLPGSWCDGAESLRWGAGLALNRVQLTKSDKALGLCSQEQNSVQNLQVWERPKAREREGERSWRRGGRESRGSEHMAGRLLCPGVAQFPV